jgi:bifunctional DNase/RNase
MNLRPCYLSHVLIDEAAQSQVILISERDGTRRFPITIGVLEATAIDRAVKEQRFPRPLTHDLCMELIRALGGRLTAVRIVDLREQTFHAELVLIDRQGSEIAVDCRPSDALALLVRQAGIPLLVEEAVLAEAGG